MFAFCFCPCITYKTFPSHSLCSYEVPHHMWYAASEPCSSKYNYSVRQRRKATNPICQKMETLNGGSRWTSKWRVIEQMGYDGIWSAASTTTTTGGRTTGLLSKCNGNRPIQDCFSLSNYKPILLQQTLHNILVLEFDRQTLKHRKAFKRYNFVLYFTQLVHISTSKVHFSSLSVHIST